MAQSELEHMREVLQASKAMRQDVQDLRSKFDSFIAKLDAVIEIKDAEAGTHG